MENIFDTIDTSLTDCHLKCTLLNDCIGYGAVESSPIGQRVECFILGEQRNDYPALYALRGDTIDLYVVSLVCVFIVTLFRLAFINSVSFCIHFVGRFSITINGAIGVIHLF